MTMQLLLTPRPRYQPLYRVEVAYKSSSHRSKTRVGTEWTGYGEGVALPLEDAIRVAKNQSRQGAELRVVDSNGSVVWLAGRTA